MWWFSYAIKKLTYIPIHFTVFFSYLVLSVNCIWWLWKVFFLSSLKKNDDLAVSYKKKVLLIISFLLFISLFFALVFLVAWCLLYIFSPIFKTFLYKNRVVSFKKKQEIITYHHFYFLFFFNSFFFAFLVVGCWIVYDDYDKASVTNSNYTFSWACHSSVAGFLVANFA